VLLYLWNTWWIHQALLVEHASPLWTSWIGWPSGVNLILHTLGLAAVAPWVWLMEWRGGSDGVLLAHNAVVLASFILTAIGTYALAAMVSRSRPAALIAAIPFAFSAHRLWMIGRTDLLSTQYFVFFVLLLLRTLRGGRLNAVGTGLLAAAVAYNIFTHAFFAVLLGVGLLATDPKSTARAWRRLGVAVLVAGALAAPLLWAGARSLLADEAGWALTRAKVPIEIVTPEGSDPRHFRLRASVVGLLADRPDRDGCLLAPGAEHGRPLARAGARLRRPGLGALPADRWASERERSPPVSAASGDSRLRDLEGATPLPDAGAPLLLGLRRLHRGLLARSGRDALTRACRATPLRRRRATRRGGTRVLLDHAPPPALASLRSVAAPGPGSG
jgi:hypothetical protein